MRFEGLGLKAGGRTVTKPIGDMTKEELIWAIEGYAASARRSYYNGKDPWQTLNRVRSMIDRYRDAPDADPNSRSEQPAQ
jgi:hypothetical protein